MTEQTTQSILISAPPEKVMDVIADFASYPEWASAVKSVDVLARVGREGTGRGEHVRFVLDAGMVKDTYELRYRWAGDGHSVNWELVTGKVQKSQHGSYTLRDTAEGTQVTYSLRVDLAIPMIGMFRRKAEKVITDTALKELRSRVEG